MKVKQALLNDLLRKKEKLKFKVSDSQNNQQHEKLSKQLMQYSQMAKYKQYDLQLDQYLLKDEFRKEAMYIIGS